MLAGCLIFLLAFSAIPLRKEILIATLVHKTWTLLAFHSQSYKEYFTRFYSNLSTLSHRRCIRL